MGLHWPHRWQASSHRDLRCSQDLCNATKNCGSWLASDESLKSTTPLSPDEKKRQPCGWRFCFSLKLAARSSQLPYSGFLRPKPGRWPEPAGAPRRLPDGLSSASLIPGRFGAGLAGRLLVVSAGRSATGVPRPAGAPRSPRSVRPLAGRGLCSDSGNHGAALASSLASQLPQGSAVFTGFMQRNKKLWELACQR